MEPKTSGPSYKIDTPDTPLEMSFVSNLTYKAGYKKYGVPYEDVAVAFKKSIEILDEVFNQNGELNTMNINTYIDGIDGLLGSLLTRIENMDRKGKPYSGQDAESHYNEQIKSKEALENRRSLIRSQLFSEEKMKDLLCSAAIDKIATDINNPEEVEEYNKSIDSVQRIIIADINLRRMNAVAYAVYYVNLAISLAPDQRGDKIKQITINLIPDLLSRDLGTATESLRLLADAVSIPKKLGARIEFCINDMANVLEESFGHIMQCHALKIHPEDLVADNEIKEQPPDDGTIEADEPYLNDEVPEASPDVPSENKTVQPSLNNLAPQSPRKLTEERLGLILAKHGFKLLEKPANCAKNWNGRVVPEDWECPVARSLKAFEWPEQEEPPKTQYDKAKESFDKEDGLEAFGKKSESLGGGNGYRSLPTGERRVSARFNDERPGMMDYLASNLFIKTTMYQEKRGYKGNMFLLAEYEDGVGYMIVENKNNGNRTYIFRTDICQCDYEQILGIMKDSSKEEVREIDGVGYVRHRNGFTAESQAMEVYAKIDELSKITPELRIRNVAAI